MSIHVFGIRHHGPGCARSLRAALEELQPDIVLVEGPPDAAAVLPLLGHERMQPPVALLVYDPAAPQCASFYPFARFSPEWQALHYATERGITARFVDLPQAAQFGLRDQPSAISDQPKEAGVPGDAEASSGESAAGVSESAGVSPVPVSGEGEGDIEPDKVVEAMRRGQDVRDDPIGMLAEAAGYDDHELWWEHQIEQRQDAAGLFEGILEAMGALRAASDEADDSVAPATPPDQEGQAEAPSAAGRDLDSLREAYMRQAIRAARRDGHARIAVVCGAWHAPVLAEAALDARGAARADAALLAGLPRVKVAATWIPWTNGRLAQRSGYGAGVRSPGWYDHLWSTGERRATAWLSRVAHLLRSEDLDASPASVVEAVRLADALAAMRGLPMPGLAELHEAALTVLCAGDGAPMALIRERLEIGERLGEVPEETPVVPLQADLTAAQRRLRLKPSAEERTLDLDLRDETGRERSRLLHRLSLLDVAWGRPRSVSGKSGTFHEVWALRWAPELSVALIEANVWGNTVEAAASARARHEGDAATELPQLTALVDAAILATLPDAVAHLLGLVERQAAVASDVRLLMAALPPLARVARYGDVRGTAGTQVEPVIDALFERIVVGLPGACSALDDDAAEEIVKGMAYVQESLSLLDRPEQGQEWRGVLRALIERDGVHGLVRGWACRLLLEAKALDGDELQRLARLALSPVLPAGQAAAWLTGVLRGSGQLLLHQDGLWRALDGWLSGLSPEGFVEALPLVRRAFADFQPPERRAMGEKVKRLQTGQEPVHAGAAADHDDIDRARADLVLPVLAQILGLKE